MKDVILAATSIEPVKGPGKRKLTLKTDGSFTYGPRPNFHGILSLTHKATDGAADSNVAIVTIRVRSVPG